MSEQFKCRINLLYNDLQSEIWCNKGSILINVLNQNNIYLDAPCGGKCLCGKCKVKVIGDCTSVPTDGELKFLTDKERKEGYRLACAMKVVDDIEVMVESNNSAQIMSEGIGNVVEISPIVRKKFVQLEKPTKHDQKDDLQRLLDTLGMQYYRIHLQILRELPDLIRDHNYEITVVYSDREIISVEGGDTSNTHYGIAVDIGTTTVVAYLVDITSGREIDVVSQLNAQKSFGSDVISRITYTLENMDGLKQLQQKIISQINHMINSLVEKNKLNIETIHHIVLVGNTTMLHLLTGITPKNIATSPFIPVSTQELVCRAEDLGLNINSKCAAYLLCSISGYVGADIVAAILASGMAEKHELSLLIDIGTNGEIALGNKDQIICCSTAAGPAFEGAHIRNGVGGIAGAINTVRLEGDQVKYTTILDHKPIGICGSGIIDILSILVEIGIVDETGRIVDEDEVKSEIGKKLTKNVIEIEGMPAFVIAKETETKNKEAIVITQKDIREVQLAKAAIAGGINTLIKSMGKKIEDISHVYLAGGFGSYIDKQSAVNIGLLPKVLKDNIIVLGNAAGTGAVMSLLSQKCYHHCTNIKNKAKYIELSTSQEFQDEYINCMYF